MFFTRNVTLMFQNAILFVFVLSMNIIWGSFCRHFQQSLEFISSKIRISRKLSCHYLIEGKGNRDVWVNAK